MNIATDFPEVYSYLFENNKDDIVTNNDDDSNLDNSLDLFQVTLPDQQQQQHDSFNPDNSLDLFHLLPWPISSSRELKWMMI